jgi:hypothetical protein
MYRQEQPSLLGYVCQASVLKKPDTLMVQLRGHDPGNPSVYFLLNAPRCHLRHCRQAMKIIAQFVLRHILINLNKTSHFRESVRTGYQLCMCRASRGTSRHRDCCPTAGSTPGWQGRSGALTSAPRPAPWGKMSAPRSAPAQVTTPGSFGGRARHGPGALASRAQPSPTCSTLQLKSLKK